MASSKTNAPIRTGRPARKKQESAGSAAKEIMRSGKKIKSEGVPSEEEHDVVDVEVLVDGQEPHALFASSSGSVEVLDPEVIFEGHEPALADGEDQDESEEIDESQFSLVQSSPLSRYLAELRKYSLLTREEERELAVKSYEHDDLAARNRLVTANLRLVVKIAMEYRRTYIQILDLIQEGNAGLVQAVNRFNPYRNVKLSTYSAWWIRAYILKFLMDNKSLVRMGTTDAQRKLFFRLRSEAERIYALTQRYDTKAIAGSIGVKEEDVLEMQERLKSDVSLDTPVDENGDVRMVDRFSAAVESPDEAIESHQMRRLVQESARLVRETLNERDLFIFDHRLMADEPITLQEVGDKYGISRERARQLESRLIMKIKEKLIAAGAIDEALGE
jgi:RNA polymerase sigma-32 factor